MTAVFTMTTSPTWDTQVDACASQYLSKLGHEMESDARRFAAVDTGLMRSRIYHEVNGLNLRVGVRNVEYWMTVEFGSAPHIITPSNKKALYWPGARHPVARVNHPGTPSQPFLRPALYRRRGAL